MADPTPIFKSFPPDNAASLTDAEYDKAIRAFANKLAGQKEAAFNKNAESPNDLLEVLDPSVHTLSYLFTLHARAVSVSSKAKSIAGPLQPGGYLFARISDFLDSFDPIQIRYAGTSWREIVELMERVARQSNMPAIAISPLRTALLRLDPSGGTFTSTHVLFLRVCLDSRHYEEALPVLDNVIHSFPTKEPLVKDGSFMCSKHIDGSSFITKGSGLSQELLPADVHEYFMLGGLVYLSLHRWEDAFLFFEHIITSPTQDTPTGLMLEAYKKWILVGCLVHGDVPPLPKATNNLAIKSIKSAAKAYDALAGVFQYGDMMRLQAEFDVGEEIWVEDCNYELAKQLVVHLPHFYIKSLQKTYAAIPVETIAGWMSDTLDNTISFLTEMISTGSLNATITSKDGTPVLRFFSDPSTGPLAKSEQEQYEQLIIQTKRTNELAGFVKAADQRLMLSNEYIEYLKKRAKTKEDDPNGAEVMDLTWDEQPGPDFQDEDLMADVH